MHQKHIAMSVVITSHKADIYLSECRLLLNQLICAMTRYELIVLVDYVRVLVVQQDFLTRRNKRLIIFLPCGRWRMIIILILLLPRNMLRYQMLLLLLKVLTENGRLGMMNLLINLHRVIAKHTTV